MKPFIEPLMKWYQKNHRELPWRKDTEPYHIWISEIMLQQTRVEAVKFYYERFIKELPTVEALSSVSEERLLKLWEGLGYYSRAKNLQKAAKKIVEEIKGYVAIKPDVNIFLFAASFIIIGFSIIGKHPIKVSSCLKFVLLVCIPLLCVMPSILFK